MIIHMTHTNASVKESWNGIIYDMHEKINLSFFIFSEMNKYLCLGFFLLKT